MSPSDSLCETCSWHRDIHTTRGSRFLLCQLSGTRADFPKYPRQPLLHCSGYQQHSPQPPEAVDEPKTT